MLLSIDDAISLQLKLAKRVIKHDTISYSKIRYVCGVDVSYRNDRAFASAVMIDRFSFNVLDSANIVTASKEPYLQGLFFLRETRPILEVMKKLGRDYDVLMVNGHGLLHPRECGLACSIGIKIGKPTIGVAKNLLCGTISKTEPDAVLLNNKIAGYVLSQGTKNLYVSIGHMISLNTAVKLTKQLLRTGLPEPLRLAHLNSRKLAKKV